MDFEEARQRLAQLHDPAALKVNRRHGDEHGVKLSALRSLAKEVGRNDALARELWASGESAARLLATLVCRPRSFEAAELDAMLRQASTPKERDWLLNYVVKKSPHAEELRVAWLGDATPEVAAAGWTLTADRVAKGAVDLDEAALLTTIETQMSQAPEALQWAMNTCLAQIGIHREEHRARAVEIGESLGVLKDYPTSAGCTSPYAPEWIAEMVRRNEQS
ncbi:DNA alkylation repair protein [Corynebacterium lowii]|uniref:DNA alkylation repair enzyme n=1 Tax=Corynebacterium lowii TaxID=1544413 RepID=A0A0Q0U2B3_9CORY|nr:DNA alkylation repair protein [Corynebacterium lowii]KQB85991.1 DNA alkylation repair enzyme [Corynebacterium lowii]MDP9850579.1 3-methyladenine DNA glycosylase AlkD [Corynebacterium lowii]